MQGTDLGPGKAVVSKTKPVPVTTSSSMGDRSQMNNQIPYIMSSVVFAMKKIKQGKEIENDKRSTILDRMVRGGFSGLVTFEPKA